MYCHTQLKCFANIRSLDTLPDATPEGCVQQDYVDGSVEYVCRELFKVNDHGIGRKRHTNFLAGAAHTVQTINRIFEVVVSDVLDLLAEPHGSFCRPDSVWVESEAVAMERICNRAITFQFVLRGEDSALQLVRSKTMF